jgi:hypothetical protein
VREPPEPVDEAVGLGTSHQGGAAEEASWGVDQLERARARMRRGPGGGEGRPEVVYPAQRRAASAWVSPTESGEGGREGAGAWSWWKEAEDGRVAEQEGTSGRPRRRGRPRKRRQRRRTQDAQSRPAAAPHCSQIRDFALHNEGRAEL